MRRCRPLLGTYVEVTANDAAAIDAAFAAIEQIHALMSAHEPDSELSRINRFAHLRPVRVSELTRAVLQRALHWWRQSGGTFDAARAGAQSLANGHLPLHADQPAPQACDMAALSLDDNQVRLSAPTCLDLGGIAKGFAVDQAVAAMREAGAQSGLVNAGGDLFAFGPEPWPVQVLDPLSRQPMVEIALSNQALTTSALHADGTGAHLPPSGPGDWVSVSVRAASACDADALTKIVWALGHGAADLLDRADAEAIIFCRSGEVQAIERRAAAA